MYRLHTSVFFSSGCKNKTVGWATQNPRFQFSHSSGGQSPGGAGRAPCVVGLPCLSACGQSKGACTRALSLSLFSLLTTSPAGPGFEPAASAVKAVCPNLWTSREAPGALFVEDMDVVSPGRHPVTLLNLNYLFTLCTLWVRASV